MRLSSIINLRPFLLRREDEKLEAAQVRRIIATSLAFSPSSAVRREAVLIVRGLGNFDPGFLHYIFDCILNDPALLWQKQTQSLQQYSHQPLRACHRS